jgi:hypothetical protein
MVVLSPLNPIVALADTMILTLASAKWRRYQKTNGLNDGTVIKVFFY